MSFRFIDLSPDREDMAAVVLAGLARSPKSLPPWLFYDHRGSVLFEAICQQPEYYPTRAEMALLEQHGAAIAEAVGPERRVIELGSGASQKAARLLTSLDSPASYVAIDISESALRQACGELAAAFPELEVTAVCADYGQGLPPSLRGEAANGSDLAFFPGSTIGNMNPVAAEQFLHRWAERLGSGAMLVGADLHKDSGRLNAAYNDAAGVTAAFNLNLLQHLNREIGADFDLDAFSHLAFFNEEHSRIEMHLVSDREQQVSLGGQRFDFAEGERLHTESSYKYSSADFQALASRSGFQPREVWTDDEGLFTLHLLQA